MFGQSNGFLGLKTGTMNTEYHDDNTEEENSFFRTKGIHLSVPLSVHPLVHTVFVFDCEE